jgi:hypothetical protein
MVAKSFYELTDGTQFRLSNNTNMPIYTKQGKQGLLNGPGNKRIDLSPSTTVHVL